MKNWYIGLLGIVISGVAIIFILLQIDLQQLQTALTEARYIYVVPCIALLLLGLVTRALRWRVLLENGLSFRRTFSIMNAAYLVNGILPLRIGEVARVYLASQGKQSVPVFKTTSTIITERLLDLLAVVVMALFALSNAPLPDSGRQTALGLGITAIVGFSILIVLAWQRDLTERFVATVVEQIPLFKRLNVQQWAAHFLDGLAPLTQPFALVAAIGWTAISWIVSIGAGYVLMFAFYDVASWSTTMLYISSAAFAIAVPAVPGNLGTYEASIVGALTVMGYAFDGTAVSFAVMVHAVNLFVHAATGAFGLMQEGISLQQLTKGVSQMQQVSHSEAS